MKSVLLITIGYSPNIGGIETHFDDLTKEFTKRKIKTSVLTYKPHLKNISAKYFENKNNIKIYRLPLIENLFYKLVKHPILEFLYLVPLLFMATPFVILLNKPNTIFSHGLIAGSVGVFWGKFFGIKTAIATHSIYEFPEKSLYKNFAKYIFKNTDKVLTLSEQSKKEIEKLTDRSDIVKFTYWIDLEKFSSTKNKDKKFTVLFVGRLVEIKGIKVLIKAAKKWNKHLPAQAGINLQIVGTGPMKNYVEKNTSKNIKYLGKVNNDDLPKYYSSSHLLIVPSINQEGFGRVIIESLSCGTPVIGSNMGGIGEAMNNKVGDLINPTEDEIIKSVEYYYKNRKELERKSKAAIKFARKNYSNKNAEKIIKTIS